MIRLVIITLSLVFVAFAVVILVNAVGSMNASRMALGVLSGGMLMGAALCMLVDALKQ